MKPTTRTEPGFWSADWVSEHDASPNLQRMRQSVSAGMNAVREEKGDVFYYNASSESAQKCAEYVVRVMNGEKEAS